MTVLELINKLLHLPPEATVSVSEYSGYPGSECVQIYQSFNEVFIQGDK